jgi:(heptosyl)LPS beta-1,4-glucosyltransferase
VTKISVVINTLNEEKNLPRAISSVKSFADEIVVVDMESTDKTAELAKSLGAKVFTHKKTGYVEPARNFALRQAQGPWLLVLDADEEVPQGLALQIQKILKNPKADYYRIPRKNIIFGSWIKHTLWWPDNQIRLFKKGQVSWNEIIHSVPMTLGTGADLPVKEDLAIVHHNYDSIEQYLERLNRYTSVQSIFLIKDNYKFVWTDLINKPFKEFINRYFTGEGYKDGIHGLALSLLQAFSELVVYLKIWQGMKFMEQEIRLKDVVSEMRSKEKESHYWQSDAMVKSGGGFLHRIRRKLKV